MDIFDKLFPENLYHSYIITGKGDVLPSLLLKYLEKRGHINAQSPDVLSQTYDSFTVSDCKIIKEWHSKKGITEEKRVCIIATKFVNHEASQALLKILEEPGENTHFFIIIPPSVRLIDTILSRSHVVHVIDHADGHNNKFLTLSPDDRITYVADLVKRHEDDDGSGGLRHEATALVGEIEKSMYEKFKADRTKVKNFDFIFEELQKARDYLSTPGASVKMILEHVALII
jgi:hypothetical protein